MPLSLYMDKSVPVRVLGGNRDFWLVEVTFLLSPALPCSAPNTAEGSPDSEPCSGRYPHICQHPCVYFGTLDLDRLHLACGMQHVDKTSTLPKRIKVFCKDGRHLPTFSYLKATAIKSVTSEIKQSASREQSQDCDVSQTVHKTCLEEWTTY